MNRVAKLTVLLALVGFAAASLEQRLLWGYWLARPHIDLVRPDAVAAFSVFTTGPDGSGYRRSDRMRVIARSAEQCRGIDDNCLEGHLLRALGPLLTPATPEWTTAEFAATWSNLPAPHFQPREIVALRLSTDTTERAAFCYRSAELSNDRFTYGETLVSLEGPRPRIVHRTQSQFEIAGLEALTIWVLWPLNVLVLLCASGLIRIWARRRASAGG